MNSQVDTSLLHRVAAKASESGLGVKLFYLGDKVAAVEIARPFA